MNEIEELIRGTNKDHDRERSGANFWVSIAIIGNVIIPLLVLAAIIWAACFSK